MLLNWLPGAIRRPMHETGFPWQANCPPKIVWHTTEGFGVPNYPSQYEPHLTVVATASKGVTVYQHIALTNAAYALKHTGAAPTNGAHALQIELAGTCDPNGPTGAYYWPQADDAVLRDLWVQVGKPLADAFHVPLAAPSFKAYPASAGANGVRFTDAEWLAWHGHCGHQHIPGNDHGDPGAFPWDRFVHLAATGDEMTPDDWTKLQTILDNHVGATAQAIHSQQLYRATWTDSSGKPRPLTFADALLTAARKQVPTATDIAAAVKAELATIPTTQGGTAATLDDATIARLAAAVWDTGAARLVR